MSNATTEVHMNRCLRRNTVSILLPLLLIGCVTEKVPIRTYSGDVLEGSVLEQGTNKPIPGAIVVARWKGTVGGLGHSQTMCFHVETTTTDAQGRYRIPPWQKPYEAGIYDPSSVVSVYKPGYETTNYRKGRLYRREDRKYVVTLNAKPNDPKIVDTLKEAQMAVGINDHYLKPFTGTRGERLEYLSYRVISGMSCSEARESYKNLYQLYRTAYEEAAALAQTSVEKKRAERFKEIADDTLVNHSKPTKYDEQGRLINVDPKDTFRAEDLK